MHPIDELAVSLLLAMILLCVVLKVLGYGIRRLERYVDRKYPSDRG